jgi:hypothetical protein
MRYASAQLEPPKVDHFGVLTRSEEAGREFGVLVNGRCVGSGFFRSRSMLNAQANTPRHVISTVNKK